MSGIVRYRRLSDSELEDAAELSRRVFDEFVAAEHSAEGREEFARYASVAALRERHRIGGATFAAERDGRLVGMLHLRNGNHIAMLFVEGLSQRQGIGFGLVCAAEQWVLARQPRVQTLTVASTPNAVDAYRRMGFLPLGDEQVTKGLRFVLMERRIGISHRRR